jgi:organic radical activating enzyme
VDRLADALLDPTVPRDGLTILGGEPFLQPVGLGKLVEALRARGCPHIVVYSGYTYERLRRVARTTPVIDAILADVDVLIDGPFVATLADRADPWTGSANQRVIDLARTRRSGRVVCSPHPGKMSATRALKSDGCAAPRQPVPWAE